MLSFGRLGDEVRLGARRGVGLVVAERGDEVPVFLGLVTWDSQNKSCKYEIGLSQGIIQGVPSPRGPGLG